MEALAGQSSRSRSKIPIGGWRHGTGVRGEERTAVVKRSKILKRGSSKQPLASKIPIRASRASMSEPILIAAQQGEARANRERGGETKSARKIKIIRTQLQCDSNKDDSRHCKFAVHTVHWIQETR